MEMSRGILETRFSYTETLCDRLDRLLKGLIDYLSLNGYHMRRWSTKGRCPQFQKHLGQCWNQGKAKERKNWKFLLVQGLYEKGYNGDQVRDLFRFIDWTMVLPEKLGNIFWNELKAFEQEKNMTFITSVEEIGFKRATRGNGTEIISKRDVCGRNCLNYRAVDRTSQKNPFSAKGLKFLPIEILRDQLDEDLMDFVAINDLAD